MHLDELLNQAEGRCDERLGRYKLWKCVRGRVRPMHGSPLTVAKIPNTNMILKGSIRMFIR